MFIHCSSIHQILSKKTEIDKKNLVVADTSYHNQYFAINKIESLIIRMHFKHIDLQIRYAFRTCTHFHARHKIYICFWRDKAVCHNAFIRFRSSILQAISQKISLRPIQNNAHARCAKTPTLSTCNNVNLIKKLNSN